MNICHNIGRTYYKQVFEASVAGEYFVTLKPNTKYTIILVGAGGGVSGVIRDLGYGWSALVATGGSGALIKSKFMIPQQTDTEFKIVVGQGGAVVSGNQASTVGGDVNKGTPSTFGINDIVLLSCEGGVGGTSPVAGGIGGTSTINEQYNKYIDTTSDFEEYKNGLSGVYFIEHHPKGDANYGSPWCRTNTAGGLSSYDFSQYGAGAGGGCVSVTPYAGQDGYCYIFQEAAIDDYEFYKDTNTYKLPTQTERKYYKYEYKEWFQPVLTSEVCAGGGFFTVSEAGDWITSYPAFRAVDADPSSIAIFQKGETGYFQIYNPNPLNITKLTIRNYGADSWGSRALTEGYIQGSVDGQTFVKISDFSNSTIGGSASWDINLELNTTYYKYYRIVCTAAYYANGGAVNQCMIADLKITATQQTIVQGTKDDYSFYEDKVTYYGIGD